MNFSSETKGTKGARILRIEIFQIKFEKLELIKEKKKAKSSRSKFFYLKFALSCLTPPPTVISHSVITFATPQRVRTRLYHARRNRQRH